MRRFSDFELLAWVAMAIRAFDPATMATAADLPYAADISFLTLEEIERAEGIYEAATPEEIEAAIARLDAQVAVPISERAVLDVRRSS